MSYSQALEEQVGLCDSVRGGFSSFVMRTIEYASTRHGPDIVSGRVHVRDLPRVRWEVETEVHLAYATPYFWSKAVCGLIAEVAVDMPPWSLTPEALPSEAGFFWMDDTLPLPGMTNMRLKALVWGPSRRPDGDGNQRVLAGSQGDGIALTTWAHDDESGKLFPCHYLDWWFGETPAGAAGRFKKEVLEHKHETFSTVAAMLAFLEQRILVAPEHRADRPARRRLERDGFTHEPLIRVVELRRKQVQSTPTGEHETVNWSHQWIVSGHWRQQWYPSLNANQPRWIMPYVKGPEDKPLKPPRAKVFAVVR